MKRKRLPDTRRSITHKLKLGDQNIYFRIGLFEDKTPGEVFIDFDQDQSGIGNAYHQIGILFSMLLQSGWTVEMLHKKFSHVRGIPEGMTGNTEIPIAKSVVDYLARFLMSEEFKRACK